MRMLGSVAGWCASYAEAGLFIDAPADAWLAASAAQYAPCSLSVPEAARC